MVSGESSGELNESKLLLEKNENESKTTVLGWEYICRSTVCTREYSRGRLQCDMYPDYQGYSSRIPIGILSGQCSSPWIACINPLKMIST